MLKAILTVVNHNNKQLKILYHRVALVNDAIAETSRAREAESRNAGNNLLYVWNYWHAQGMTVMVCA